MTARDFAFWLQGYFDLSGSTHLGRDQVKKIRECLDLVFLNDIGPTIQPVLNPVGLTVEDQKRINDSLDKAEAFARGPRLEEEPIENWLSSYQMEVDGLKITLGFSDQGQVITTVENSLDTLIFQLSRHAATELVGMLTKVLSPNEAPEAATD